MIGHRCLGDNCPVCDAAIARIEWERDAPPDPHDAEHWYRRAEARLEAQIYGEDRQY